MLSPSRPLEQKLYNSFYFKSYYLLKGALQMKNNSQRERERERELSFCKIACTQHLHAPQL